MIKGKFKWKIIYFILKVKLFQVFIESIKQHHQSLKNSKVIYIVYFSRNKFQYYDKDSFMKDFLVFSFYI